MPTGLKAANLRELVELVRSAPVDVIRHHLHRAPLRHSFGAWDYPNDFAEWASRDLGDKPLAEKLAALDPFALRDPEEARGCIVDLLEDHLDELPLVPWVRRGREFHLASSLFLALPGGREVWTIAELHEALRNVSLGSLYYHFHEARLREPYDDVDDFSRWLVGQFGASPIAEALKGIDFYFFSLEDLRERLVWILDEMREGE